MKKLISFISILLMSTLILPSLSAEDIANVQETTVASEITEEVDKEQETSVASDVTDDSNSEDSETINVDTEEVADDNLTYENIDTNYLEVSDFSSTFTTDYVDEGELEEEVDYELLADTSVDTARQNSGTETIEVSNKSRSINSSKETTISASQDVVVFDGQIVEMESGLIRTNGGADYTVAMYASIDDFGNEEMAIPISGAGFDGIYLETIRQEGEYIIHYTMSGGDFYSSASDVTLIPSEYVLAQTHYEVIDGDWYLLSSIDALTSTEYEYINLGSAPDWASTNTKYYTIDNVNFFSNIDEMVLAYKQEIGLVSTTAISTRSTNLTYSSYFQNLPFRSTSYYTATDYKNYLNKMGKSGSAYYNATKGFTDAQEKEKVNSLMLLAFADHESAYGTSTYSYKCYNFFGRFAYDSDPDQACSSTGLSSAYDGIMSQAVWIQANYFDVYDWRYHGTHAGDKTSGMNVYYASDANWGAKIGAHANSIDSYLGGNEQNLYKIIKVKRNSTVYTTSSLTTPIKVQTSSGTIKNYGTGQASNSSNGTNYIVRSKGSGYYEIQLDTAMNLTSSTCAYTKANNGAYPKFDGYSYISVAKGVASYACDYQDWATQKGYIPTTSVTELTTSSIVKPEDHAEDYDYGSCTELISTTTDSSGNTVKYMQSSNKNKQCELTYYGTSNVLKHRKDDYYTGGGSQLIETKEFSYDKNGVKTNWKLYEYYANGNRSYHTSVYYDTSGNRTVADEWTYYSSGKKKNWKKYEYYSGSKNVRKYHISVWYDSNTVRTSANEWWYRSNGNKKEWKKYEYYSNGNRSFHSVVYYDSNINRTYANEWTYRTNGKKKNWKKYEYYSNGNRSYHISVWYDDKLVRTSANEWWYRSNGDKKTWKKYEYYSNGNRSFHSAVSYDSNVKRTVANEWTYRSNGKKSNWKKYEYYSNGNRSFHITVNYDSNLNRTSAKEYTYASNGQRTQRDEKTYKNGKLSKKVSYYYTTSGTFRYSTTTYY